MNALHLIRLRLLRTRMPEWGRTAVAGYRKSFETAIPAITRRIRCMLKKGIL